MFFGKYLLVAVGCFFVVSTYSQMQENVWLRATLSKEFDSKWNFDFEVQHRRQNIFTAKNIVGTHLLSSGRTWIHYKMNSNLKLSLSPIAYFHHSSINDMSNQGIETTRNELRASMASNLSSSISTSLKFLVRPAIEYRYFLNDKTDILRIRGRIGLKYNLTKSIQLDGYYEVFFNTFSKVTVRTLDQERLGIQMDLQIQDHIKMELGYIYLIRQLADHQWRENNVILQMCYCF